MPRSFEIAADYEGSVEQLHRTFGDEPYWQARLADSGADRATLDSLQVSADGAIGITTTQVLRADRLPGVVAQFYRGDLTIKREERWTPVRDGQASGKIVGTVPGAPASLSAAMNLAPKAAGTGSRQEFTITVDVRVPLVGGKIEDFIGKGLIDLLIAEQRFTTHWIAERT